MTQSAEYRAEAPCTSASRNSSKPANVPRISCPTRAGRWSIKGLVGLAHRTGSGRRPARRAARLGSRRRGFNLEDSDSVCRGILSQVGSGVDVVITGHTHLPRWITAQDRDLVYLNAGAWARVIGLRTEFLENPEAFRPVHQAFKAADLNALDTTYVTIDDVKLPLVLDATAAAHVVEKNDTRAELVESDGPRFGHRGRACGPQQVGPGVAMTLSRFALRALRGGPHNQLVSPITEYLALCGGAAPPYTPASVRARRSHEPAARARYGLGSGRDQEELRQAEMSRLARELGTLLGSIPAFGAEISSIELPLDGGVVHFRLVLAGNELGLVPEEIAHVPVGLPGAGLPMLLQPRVPVSMTREVRPADGDSSGTATRESCLRRQTTVISPQTLSRHICWR